MVPFNKLYKIELLRSPIVQFYYRGSERCTVGTGTVSNLGNVGDPSHFGTDSDPRIHTSD
jgi:hypothetical protein